MNLNIDFKKQIDKILPADEATRLMQTIEAGESVVSLRFNDAKGFAVPSGLEQVPWCDMGAYLNERPQFTFDPHFHAGSYYVQDASSMFISHVIKSLVKQPVRYLDLCAAPGGKTTAALQALPSGSFVVANEIMPQRAQVLRENVIKWGAHNCMVTCDTPKKLGMMENMFDIIAADVPCSGEGMFRKDEEAVSQWSPSLVQQCAERQWTIINDVWHALKPGGLLIYSTCTYNIDENEAMASRIATELGATFVDVDVNEAWNIKRSLHGDIPCYRFMPHLTRGEGLFMCVLRKNGISATMPAAPSRSKHSKRDNKKQSIIPAQAQGWLGGNFELKEENGVIKATNKDIKDLLEAFGNNIRVIKDFGIELGTIKGKNLIPSHQLAMSPLINCEAFPKCEVDYPTAIAYLRGESINIDSQRGYVLITHHGATLGFVNNLGNRANNLYPKPWRIMSTHLPSTPPAII
ncbi:MAG: rRNA cytosine-C5-methyltransferase [Muribaculaceae bacterium]|nr:rRNA cytosine-C5-methyltransferase [Muribaculaceae bacterium]